METSRLDALKQMVALDPANTFARYGLAMEYLKAGDAEQAVAEFQAILEANPKYIAAYYHSGQALERLDRLDEAREAYRRGIEVCTAAGDLHARSELQAALDLLGE